MARRTTPTPRSRRLTADLPTLANDQRPPSPDIGKQLYAKYGLDDDEIALIESHVKSMG